MISQQFVDYIKLQTTRGVPPEEIKRILKINGLSEQDIAEGFSLTEVSVAAAAPTPIQSGTPRGEKFQIATSSSVTPSESKSSVQIPASRPIHILYFELLMYVAILVGVVSKLLTPGILQLEFAYSVQLLPLLLIPLLYALVVYGATHRRIQWLRILLLVFFVQNLLSLFAVGGYLSLRRLDFEHIVSPVGALLISLTLQAIAFYFGFSKVSNAWYASGQVRSTPLNPGIKNKTWTKVIPVINSIFLIIALGIFVMIDLPILYEDWSLLFFAYIMLAALGVFVIFTFLEMFPFRKRFEHSQSPIDGWLVVLIVIRNIAFVLNVIPFIQLLGMAAVGIGGIPYLILYAVLTVQRSKAL